ncbi:MAG: FAD-binding protein, partial [Pseudomonadota bacterium]
MTGFDGSGLLERLGEAAQDLRGKLRPNTSLAELTWFRVGGPAELFFAPQDVADLQLFLRLLPIDVPVTVLGLASNTLVRDGGIPGAVVKLSGKPFTSCELDGTRLSAGSGLAVKRLASVALRASIGGMHFFHGIPGSLGGALRMNAGANGIETADCVYSVDAVDRNGDRLTLTKAQMGFSY